LSNLILSLLVISVILGGEYNVEDAEDVVTVFEEREGRGENADEGEGDSLATIKRPENMKVSKDVGKVRLVFLAFEESQVRP
jgi:hypothetical protein